MSQLPQASFVLAALLVAWILFLAVNDRLKVYLGFVGL